ncbi:MAG: ABC transporter permease [Chloroflexi bacterium]|nr:ABC transporter permease [Chloroflexota bacterium]
MFRFLVRRIILLVPVLIGILFVTFAMTRMIPGDACAVMLGERYTPEKCAEFREQYGLNDNIVVQFGRYLTTVGRGDFGVSIRNGRPVTTVLSERLPMTFELTVGAMAFASIVGILLGIISAIRHNSGIDVGTMIGANIGVSMPVFWLGLMLAYLFAILLKGTPLWLPPSSRLTAGVSMTPLDEVWHLQNLPGFPHFIVDFVSNSVILHSLITGQFDVTWDAVRHLILPSLAVGTIPLAIIARLTRSSLLEVLGQEYVRTARAKGLRERTILVRHAMRNAMIPIITIVGLQIGSLLSGAVLTETVFALPGVGTQLVDSIFARDYPVVQGFVVVVALVFASVNIIVDLSYSFLDPRIRAQ